MKEEEKILIRVYSGTSIEDKCDKQLHPLSEVIKADNIIKDGKSIDCYSNCPDFISSIRYLAEKTTIETEFFLDGVSHGNDIDAIFSDFNRSFDLMDELYNL